MDHFASDVIKEKFVDMLKQLKNIIQDYHNGVEREDSTQCGEDTWGFIAKQQIEGSVRRRKITKRRHQGWGAPAKAG